MTWTFKVLKCQSGSAFAGATQAAQLRGCRISKGKRTAKVASTIASTSFEQALPEILTLIARGHRRTENRLHRVRDETFDQYRSQVRTGSCPQIMASLRSTAITLLRTAGNSDIPAALREHAYYASVASKSLFTCRHPTFPEPRDVSKAK